MRRFAMASCTRGQRCSAGWSSGECAGRNTRWMPSGTTRRFEACQPARSSTSTMRLLGTGANRPGEVLQGQREDLGVDVGQDDPLHLAAPGANESVEVQPLVPALPERQGAFAAGGPHPAHDGDQSEARFVLRPEVQRFPVDDVSDLSGRHWTPRNRGFGTSVAPNAKCYCPFSGRTMSPAWQQPLVRPEFSTSACRSCRPSKMVHKDARSPRTREAHCRERPCTSSSPNERH